MAIWDNNSPFPVPTPYQSPEYGGNPYVAPGTTGQSISSNDYPIGSQVDGGTLWSSGKITYGQGKPQVPESTSTPWTPVPTGQTLGDKTPVSTTTQQQTGGGGTDQRSALISAMTSKGHSQATAEAAIAGRGVGDLWNEYMGGGGGGGDGGGAGLEAARAEAERLRAEEETRKQAVRSGITAQYQPVFAELDRRLGLIPGEETGLKKTVEDLYSTMSGQAEAYGTAPKGSIELARGKAETGAKETLRDLAEAGQGALGAVQKIYGASSVSPVIQGQMTRELSKQRADILGQRDEAFAELNLKITEVDSMIASEKSKIDMWKTTELQKIGEEIRSRTDQINAQKVGASTEKAANLTALEMQIFQNAQQRLLNLDNQISEYTMSLDLYKEKTQTDLANYGEQLKLMSQYQQPDYGFNLADLTPAQAQQISSGTGEDFDWRGYRIQPEKETRMINGIPSIWNAAQNAWVPQTVIGSTSGNSLLQQGGFGTGT